MSTPAGVPPTDCPYEMWDGAYVLGSLSPAERREFEAHLDGCETCSRSVRDLAGLPGLLGRIGPEIFEESEPEPVPETLLPRLSRAVRRGQQRRTWLTAGIAAAAAVAVTTGGAIVLDRSTDGSEVAVPPTTSSTTLTPSGDPTVTTPVVHHRLMTRVGRDPMTASVAVTPVKWGVKVDLTCTYPRGSEVYEGGSYALWIHTKDGRQERIATWNGLPGKSMEVTGGSDLWKPEIRSLVVTRSDGAVVSRLML